MRNFSIDTEEYNQNGPIPSDGCNAIIFWNLSDTEITIDNVPIPAYSSGMVNYPCLTYYGLEGEKMQDKFSLKFNALATTKRVLVTRKTYL